MDHARLIMSTIKGQKAELLRSLLQTFMLAGLASGVTEAIIVNPFEVIKVKMQSNRAHQVHPPPRDYTTLGLVLSNFLPSYYGTESNTTV